MSGSFHYVFSFRLSRQMMAVTQ